MSDAGWGGKALWLAAGLLAAAAGGVAAYKAWPLLHPEVVAEAPLDFTCDLHKGPCDAHLPGGGEVRLDITPRPLRTMVPLTVAVQLRDLTASAVELDLQGVDMNMGYNRPALAPQGDGRDGRFVGSAMVPVCVRDIMEWQARVLIHSDRGLLAAPFRFSTAKP